MQTTRSLVKKFTPILTLGASLLLGLLSFSGMFALWPLLSLAIISFVLSVLYEGEIYQKNINQALDKLFNANLIAEKIGKEAVEELLKQSPEHAFVKEYQECKDSSQKKQLEVLLAKSLLQKNIPTVVYLKTSLERQKWQGRAQTLESRNNKLKLFSILTSIVMTLGTIFLLLDTLSVLPFFAISAATLPYVVIPLSIISGIAYGFLTYNSLASFLLDHSLSEWWRNFKNQLTQSPRDYKKILFIIGASLIFILNLTLTLCTAGTWWTLMNQSRKLWPWLQNIGIRILQFITPFVMGAANLGFNSRNIVETVKAITPKETETHHHQCDQHEHEHKQPKASETLVQRWNFFRFLLKITYMPLRVLLFLGHLVSIGVTGDQMPGMPAIASALLGIVSEGFEDAHYFFDLKTLFNENHGHDHDDEEHGHEHSDLPNRILQILFSPLFFLASVWHYFAQARPKTKSFTECYDLMQGKTEHHEHHHESPALSDSYRQAQAIIMVQEQVERLQQASFSLELTEAKIKILKGLITLLSQDTLRHSEVQAQLQSTELKAHRFSLFSTGKTTTETAMEEVENLLFSFPQDNNSLRLAK
jgi:hypothetical protein